MSKKKQKKQTKKQTKKLPIIILIAFCVFIIAVISLSIVSCSKQQSLVSELCSYQWIPSSAKNSSGDEVDMAEVYNSRYTTYQGSLSFTQDGRFSLWLSPGETDDGTHTGSYSVNDNEISAFFDDGTNTKFKIHRKNGKTDGIIINYNDYEIYFINSEE